MMALFFSFVLFGFFHCLDNRVGGLTVAKIQKMEIMPVLDIAMVGFLIGQGIGRWGNFMNQEAYGSPTDLPWRMMSEGTDNIGVHPCFS